MFQFTSLILGSMILASPFFGVAPAPDCVDAIVGSEALVGLSHDVEEAAALVHDYLHDTYEENPLADPAIGASHEVEEQAAYLHDLLHEIDEFEGEFPDDTCVYVDRAILNLDVAVAELLEAMAEGGKVFEGDEALFASMDVLRDDLRLLAAALAEAGL